LQLSHAPLHGSTGTSLAHMSDWTTILDQLEIQADAVACQVDSLRTSITHLRICMSQSSGVQANQPGVHEMQAKPPVPASPGPPPARKAPPPARKAPPPTHHASAASSPTSFQQQHQQPQHQQHAASSAGPQESSSDREARQRAQAKAWTAGPGPALLLANSGNAWGKSPLTVPAAKREPSNLPKVPEPGDPHFLKFMTYWNDAKLLCCCACSGKVLTGDYQDRVKSRGHKGSVHWIETTPGAYNEHVWPLLACQASRQPDWPGFERS
jgi:hypothetical protein